MKLPIDSTNYSDPEAKFTVASRGPDCSGIQGYFKTRHDANTVASYLREIGHTNVSIEKYKSPYKLPYLDKDTKVAMLAFGALFAALGALIVGLVTVDAVSCYSKWSGTGYKAEYGILSECRVQVNGTFIPADNFKILEK